MKGQKTTTTHEVFRIRSSGIIQSSISMISGILQFFSIVYTHFLKACLIFSELYTQMQKNTHNGQNPSILLQNETLHSKQCYFFSKWYFVFKWHTQTIIWIDIYKNQLNTDVLNVKHYDEWKTLLLHSS